MARPRKTETMKKRITIRVSDKTFEKLEALAKESGLRIGDVVRRRLEGARIPNRKDMENFEESVRLRQLIVKQGGLIKHLYSMNPFEPEVTLSILKKQESAFEKLNFLLDKMEKNLNDSENSGRA